MAINNYQAGEPGSVPSGSVLQRGGALGDGIFSELMPNYYEQCARGNVWYTGSVAECALSANTITLSATTTPIIGIWNPASSSINCVLLWGGLQVSLQAASSTRQGAWVWASSTGNAAISTGASCYNARTLSTTGPKGASATKGFIGSVALTGLTNALVITRPAMFNCGIAITSASVPATAVVPVATDDREFKGMWIVPPGGVLALLNTNSTTMLSTLGVLSWMEVPIIP
jgi:hypothetical protein